MSFNALSLAKLGVGFGALAIASIGLLAPTQVEAIEPHFVGGGGWTQVDSDPRRVIVAVLPAMPEILLPTITAPLPIVGAQMPVIITNDQRLQIKRRSRQRRDEEMIFNV